eukprot:Lankesteria_metandrocarpae@DN5070_c0_g1_i1.p1
MDIDIRPYIKSVATYHELKGITMNGDKEQETTTTKPPIRILGKTVSVHGVMLDDIPTVSPHLIANAKLNAMQKLLVYRQTTLAKWLYGIRCIDDLDVEAMDRKTRGQVKQLFRAPRDVSKDKLLKITGNAFLPSVIVGSKHTTQRCKIPPHPLFATPHGVYLIRIASGRVDKPGPCPLCAKFDGNTTSHLLTCPKTPELTEKGLTYENYLTKIDTVALQYLKDAFVERNNALLKNDPNRLSPSLKEFVNIWEAAIQTGLSNETEIKVYVCKTMGWHLRNFSSKKSALLRKHPNMAKELQEQSKSPASDLSQLPTVTLMVLALRRWVYKITGQTGNIHPMTLQTMLKLDEHQLEELKKMRTRQLNILSRNCEILHSSFTMAT